MTLVLIPGLVIRQDDLASDESVLSMNAMEIASLYMKKLNRGRHVLSMNAMEITSSYMKKLNRGRLTILHSKRQRLPVSHDELYFVSNNL